MIIAASTVLDTDAASLAVTNIDAIVAVDTDGDSDGIPDWWELQYFGSTNVNLTLDQDSDGVSNADEYVADTNPTNSASYLRFTEVLVVPAGLKMDWLGGINSTQYLQRSLSLDVTDSWSVIHTLLPPTPISGSYTANIATNVIQFYRIQPRR